MNTFNRVMAILCLLGLIVVLVAGIFQFALVADLLRRGLNTTVGLVQYYPVPFWGVSAALLFVAILLLILEVRRPRPRTVRVQQASGSVVDLSVESVSDSLQYHLAQVPGVKAVRPLVISRGHSVQVRLDLETEPDTQVPAKSEEVVQLARELIEGRLGLKLASAKVNIRQAAFGAQTVAAAPRAEVGPFETDTPALSS